MAVFDSVRVAAVQATPVILDAEATIEKAIGLIGEAADLGATLVVFPECFVSLYPSGAWAAPAATWSSGCDELWEAMWASSVDVRGPLVARLAGACGERGAILAHFVSPMRLRAPEGSGRLRRRGPSRGRRAMFAAQR